jgi:predicted nucleic acid-binding protein
MRAALFDSSIYISGMRRGDDAILSLRRFSVDAPLWLSAVVLEELEHRAAFDSRWNEWSATSTGSNGFCFPPSVTGLKPDEYGRAWRLEMATKRSSRDVWQTMR